MSRTLLIGCSMCAAGCFGRVEPDDRPAFRIDPDQPFRLELGRGSGMDGLDTVLIDQEGAVVLHRLRRGERQNTWQTATLRLNRAALADVLRAADDNGLMRLHRAYHADVHDGTQWVLWIKQGEREKSVYFNNRFPRSVTRFAKLLHNILQSAGLDTVAWLPVPQAEARKHERELWDSIRR